ncbi:MAG: folylpolyglutamate synthase/dihydrofolate synthase family protein [bacterium]
MPVSAGSPVLPDSPGQAFFATYREAEQFLAKFTDYERMERTVSHPGDLFDLRRIQGLLDRAGNPHLGLRGVHIAGTKGKGSTAIFTDALLRAHGLASGLYTSPHLVTMEERIRIQGVPIRRDEFLKWMNFLGSSLMALKDTPLAPTYFDIMTTVCFLHFRSRSVDAAVVEVGLGGRLDSTNTFLPDACVITRLGMDHMEKLGNTLQEIAAEKAGILKPRVPAVVLPQEPEARAALELTAGRVGAPLLWLGEQIRVEQGRSGGRETFSVLTSSAVYPNLRLPVLGSHQRLNLAAAIAATELFLQRTGQGRLEPDRVREAVSGVRLPGRIEILSSDPLLVVDGAHNPVSMEALLETVRRDLRFRDLHVVFACSKDKPIRALLALLAPAASRWTLTAFPFPRIEHPEVVRKMLLEIDPDADGRVTRNAGEALEDARRRSSQQDCLLCCGSFYLVGEIFKRIPASN